MYYGVCSLSLIPLRLEPSERSEMVSQVLYGEHFEVLEKRSNWSRIRVAYDLYEGWISNLQWLELSEEIYNEVNLQEDVFSADLTEFVYDERQNLTPVHLGSALGMLTYFKHSYEGKSTQGIKPKTNIVNTALLYLNAPFLWGGKTPFGLDCSGFTQSVYKLNGVKLYRDSAQQATQGESLSFIEECEPGDLAFFDNAEGVIDHVGIVMKENYIIHAHGKVRIDRIDHTGIFNLDLKKYTHQLRVIKKIF